jgi:transcriptional regulator with XRE-family HTH domain
MMQSKNEVFSERLNKALDKIEELPKHRGRVAAVAKLFKISHQSATKWFNDETMPDRDKLKKICELTDVSLDWLVNGTPVDDVGAKQIAYPLISWDNFELEYAQYKRNKKTEKTAYFDEGKEGEIKDGFVLQVPSNEPAPRFWKNLEILVNPHKKPENDKLALVYFNSTKSLSLQEIKVVGAQVLLMSLETVPGVNSTIDINDSRVKYLGLVVKQKGDTA